MLTNPARALVPATLLIGGGHEDDIALELYSGPFEEKHGHCFSSDHVLHIKWPTTINKTVGDVSREGVMRPLFQFNCNDIDMRHQQEWRRRPISPEPGNECAAILAGPHYFTGDPFGLKEGLQDSGSPNLVAWWVARIKPEKS